MSVQEEEEVVAPGTGLARVPVGTVARDSFDARQVGLLQDLAKGAPPQVFNQFLELSARYELDPFMGQIWLAQMGGQNGANGGWVVMVGRDGLLAMANRAPDFKGLRSGVVYSADVFKKWEDEDTNETKVKHESRWVNAKDDDGKPVRAEGTAVKTRGKILGAWALVYREGRMPTYWFAEYDQYLPKSEAKREKSPWSQYDDAMIAKCAQSTALRMAFSISGLVVAEEVSTRIISAGVQTLGTPQEIDWGGDGQLAARLMVLFDKCNEMESGSWLPAKIRVTLRDKSDDQRLILAQELEDWIVGHGGEVPETPLVEEGEVVSDADTTYEGHLPEEGTRLD